MIEIIKSHAVEALLALFSGFIIGISTERLATNNLLPYAISSRLWNTTVKLIIASIVWKHLICLQLGDGLGFSASCILPTASKYIGNMASTNQDNIENLCAFLDGSEVLFTLILRCIIFCVSARFGSTLQPVGITGSISCGKSSLCKLLRETSGEGGKDAFTVIDLDSISHEILIPGKWGKDNVYRNVVEAFSGENIFDATSTENPIASQIPINRRKLGDIIFGDHVKRRRLNEITHPAISKILIKQIIKESYNPDIAIVAAEVPLLFEAGLKMRTLFGIKIVIACTPEVQLDRLMQRNADLTKEQCQQRIASQMPVAMKVDLADIVIWNDGSLEELEIEVERARVEILARVHGYFGVTLVRIITVACAFVSICCSYNILQSS